MKKRDTPFMSRILGRFKASQSSRAFPYLLTGDQGSEIAIRSAYQVSIAVVAESRGVATIYVTEDFRNSDAYQSVLRSVLDKGWSPTINVETSAFIRTKYGTNTTLQAAGLDTTKKSSNTALFEQLLTEAINARAREIRFHVRDEYCGIVHNIDGNIYPCPSISSSLGNELCANAYTVLADPTSFETGKGTFSRSIDQSCTIGIAVAGGLYNLRYQSLPEADGGYDVTMRIQKQGQGGTVPTLGDLGFTASAERELKRAANSAKGAVYATGPVGQGKTTTLYSLMYKPKEERRKYVLTFEDPVEYFQYGVTRVPVARIGYANAVKRALRMGAHIVMIGEIRDDEMGGMVKVLSEASIKVFTTLHVNGANYCISRLTGEEIKIPRQNICDVDMIAAFFYQRLMPKLCDCAHKATPELLGPERTAALERLEVPLTNVRVRNKRGCCHADGSKKCNEGKLGGIPVIEIIRPDERYMELMREGKDIDAKKHWLASCKSHVTEDDVIGKPLIGNALYHLARGTIDVADIEESEGPISEYFPVYKGDTPTAVVPFALRATN
jgi:type II secretory ATPase GspE/PulE/Tfp pilus assembly ATPase PilB-like protein